MKKRLSAFEVPQLAAQMMEELGKSLEFTPRLGAVSGTISGAPAYLIEALQNLLRGSRFEYEVELDEGWPGHLLTDSGEIPNMNLRFRTSCSAGLVVFEKSTPNGSGFLLISESEGRVFENSVEVGGKRMEVGESIEIGNTRIGFSAGRERKLRVSFPNTEEVPALAREVARAVIPPESAARGWVSASAQLLGALERMGHIRVAASRSGRSVVDEFSGEAVADWRGLRALLSSLEEAGEASCFVDLKRRLAVEEGPSPEVAIRWSKEPNQVGQVWFVSVDPVPRRWLRNLDSTASSIAQRLTSDAK